VEHSGRIKRTPPPTLELGPVKLKYLSDPSVEQRSLVLGKGCSCPLAAGVLLGLDAISALPRTMRATYGIRDQEMSRVHLSTMQYLPF
jgi:hypothetical protein